MDRECMNWNGMLAFASLPACNFVLYTSVTTQMLTVNVRGFGMDAPTSCYYLAITRGCAHISLSQSTLENYRADAIESGLKPVQAMAFNLDPIQSLCGQALSSCTVLYYIDGMYRGDICSTTPARRGVHVHVCSTTPASVNADLHVLSPRAGKPRMHVVRVNWPFDEKGWYLQQVYLQLSVLLRQCRRLSQSDVMHYCEVDSSGH